MDFVADSTIFPRLSEATLVSLQEEIELHTRAMSSTSCGITISDARHPERPLIYVNDAFVEVTGYSREEALGRSCRFLQKDDRDQPAVHRIRRAIREGVHCKALLRNYKKDGTFFWNELIMSPIKGKDGELTHFVGVQTDVTERESAKRDLLIKQEELESANRQIAALNERLKSENMRLSAELDITRQMQKMILPNNEEICASDYLDIAAFMEAADEVGGDYYDILQGDGTVKIGIGDVTDHGLESGVVMLMAQTAVRTLLNSGETDPARFLDILNQTVYGNVQRMKSDRNLSLSLIDYACKGDYGQARLSGQHEQMIVIRRDGTVEIVETEDLGFPIGLDEDIAEFFDHVTVDLQSGDGLVLFTDGITEAEGANHELFGLERLCHSAQANWQGSSNSIKDAIIADVREHIGGEKVYDDITLLVIKQK